MELLFIAIGLVFGAIGYHFFNPAKKEAEELNKKIDKSKDRVSALDYNIEVLGKQVEKKNQSLKIANAEIIELKKFIENKDAQLKTLSDQVKTLTKELTEADELKASIVTELQTLIPELENQKEIHEMILHNANMKNKDGALDFTNLGSLRALPDKGQKEVLVSIHGQGWNNQGIQLSKTILKMLGVELPKETTKRKK